jgi:hypothetical protein
MQPFGGDCVYYGGGVDECGVECFVCGLDFFLRKKKKETIFGLRELRDELEKKKMDFHMKKNQINTKSNNLKRR